MTKQPNVIRFLAIGTVLVLALGAIVLFRAVPAYAQGPTQTPCPFGNMMNGGRMGGPNNQPSAEQCTQMGGMMTMMGQGGMGHGGRMGGPSNQPSAEQCAPMGGRMGNMMMGGMMNVAPDHMGSFGPGKGMMGAWTPPADVLSGAKPLTLTSASAIAKAYISAWNSKAKLELREIMQFSNHFYAEAIEAETKRGAFEFLIDPGTGTVYAEPGPNMMWNLRYGSMSKTMGLASPTQDGDKLSISADKAVETAQAYVDKTLPGAKVEDAAIAFYGYYTLDMVRDGNIVGMLSVNGYTGQVWLHHWHGAFVAEASQQ
jgi:hypothetical protein